MVESTGWRCRSYATCTIVVVAFGAACTPDSLGFVTGDAGQADAMQLPSDGAAADGALATDAGECTRDDDCKSSSACVTSARCDPIEHRCIIDACNVGRASPRSARHKR
jgi:hypothetical protein